MEDCDMASDDGRSSAVQEVEKSYSDLHLSEQSAPVTGSVSSGHVNMSAPVSTLASSGAADVDKSEDGSQCGASSQPSIPLQGGAGGGGNVMSQMMMMMMTNGDTQPAPGSCGMPPLPDMMSTMAGGGDMPAMMKGGDMNGGMAKIFDCIIDMSLARANSDHSDDDEDSSGDELPCQYCCRSFSSQMTLKTHILVAHDQDDSVLNLTQLTISRKGRSSRDGSQHSPKDGSHRSRKYSEDAEVFASGASSKCPGQNSDSENMVIPTELAAAQFVSTVRGVKRGRTESKDLEAAEKGGASGMEETPAREDDPQTNSVQELGAFSEPSSVNGVCRRSQSHNPMEVAAGSQSRPKKTRTKRFGNGSRGLASLDGGKEHSLISPKPCAALSLGSGDGSMNPDSKDTAGGSQGLQAAAAAGPSEQAGEECPTAGRRSLRPRKPYL